MAVIIVTMVAAHPVFALAKVWASRKLADSSASSFSNSVAQIAAVMF